MHSCPQHACLPAAWLLAALTSSRRLAFRLSPSACAALSPTARSSTRRHPSACCTAAALSLDRELSTGAPYLPPSLPPSPSPSALALSLPSSPLCLPDTPPLSHCLLRHMWNHWPSVFRSCQQNCVCVLVTALSPSPSPSLSLSLPIASMSCEPCPSHPSLFLLNLTTQVTTEKHWTGRRQTGS